MGTTHLFEAVRATPGVRAVVNVTSDKCYLNCEWDRGYREDDALGGHDPYSASKACQEIVGASYRESFFSPARYREHGVAVASARAGNVIGGGDWATDRLVADIMRAIAAGEPVRIRNPHAIRPWQHVMEPLSGYLLLAEKLAEQGAEFAEAWNFGPEPGQERPVRWIVEELVRRWGDGASWQLDAGDHPHEAHFLKLDISKARARLAWRPRGDLAQALDLVVAWHAAHRAGADMRATTLAQLAAHATPARAPASPTPLPRKTGTTP
jgi:CDP-glucose 4,6-dehydratase